MNSSSMETYKIILVGDASVGKTNLLTQYVDEKFTENNISTVGIEFKNKIIELKNGMKIRLQIWDTSGQEKFMSLTKNYFRGCNLALFVFDVTNKASFDDIQMWLNSFKDVNGEKSKRVLIGNKIDLDNRVVEKEEAENFAKENDLQYFEISVKENKDNQINDMFVKIFESMTFSDAFSEKENSSEKLNKRKIVHNNKKGCC